MTYLLTRNVNKAISVLMVDFSCALKLAMPISVLSAIREASLYHVTVKGGKYLEAVADADTIVFDKTGTLTKAKPTVVEAATLCLKMKTVRSRKENRNCLILSRKNIHTCILQSKES